MARKRNTHSPSFKAKVALEAVKGLQTASEIAAHHQVHVSQLQQWKKQLQENAATLFERGNAKANPPDQQLLDQLYQQIGKLQVELEFVKKKSALFQ